MQISWPAGKLTRGQGDTRRGREEVQRCKCGEAACKGERGGAARGHVGKVTRGHGEVRILCKGANAAKPRAKVQK